MTQNNPPDFSLHKDLNLFKESIAYTARETGFMPYLIEKDYFCSVIVAYLSGLDSSLVFKAGHAWLKHTLIFTE